MIRAQGRGHVAPEVEGTFAPGGRQYVPASSGALRPWWVPYVGVRIPASSNQMAWIVARGEKGGSAVEP